MSIVDVISNPRVRQWLPGTLNSAMLLLLTASLAQWTWLIVKPPLPPLMLVAPTAVTSTNTFSLPSLLAAHLFGQVSQELTGGRLDNLPISSLNLILTGVIASGSGGYALISANGQPEEPFTIGQTVTGNAVLQAVYPDRVVIRRNGALESLMLEGADKPQPSLASSPVPGAYRAAGGTANNIVQETGNNSYTVERNQLAAMMRTPDFLRQATVVPVNGGGFQIRQIKPGSIYEKLGLHSDDVIKSVNGQPMRSAEDAIQIYQQLSNLSSVQMEIVRNGTPQNLYYQFSQN
ncbi:MAG: type II secretion system protein N [Sulfuricaulis sp.]